MSESSGELSLKSLGAQLKVLRQKAQESVADVAGAVEIDETAMRHIEQGAERPSEDILMLLLNHFGICENEAADLWMLAGYDFPSDQDNTTNTGLREDAATHPLMVMMALDLRILYSDQAHITANKRGVVISFLQEGVNLQGKTQEVPVARIGMSYEQAQDFLRVLNHTLAQADYLRSPKGLPVPKLESQVETKSKKSGSN
jgi:transcriptional regulator with XRE-family HTH domain